MTEPIKPTFIQESFARCAAYQLKADQLPGYQSCDPERHAAKLEEYAETLSITQEFITHMQLSVSEELPLLAAVFDNEGVILQLAGDSTMMKLIEAAGFKSGVALTEELSGTNAVSLAIMSGGPVQLIGDDHYHHFFHRLACYAVPFKYLETGARGAVLLMTSAHLHNPLLIHLLRTAVDAIEREMTLREQNKRLNVLNQIIMNTKKNSAIISDESGFIIEVNELAAQNFKLSRDELIGKQICELPHLGDYFGRVLTEGALYEDIEISLEGFNIVGLFDASPILNEKGSIIGAYGQFRDITERYEAEARINYMAFHDELTGLANRRMFIQTAQDEMHRQPHLDEGQLAFIYLDLDRFKLVNDSLGHTEGDRLLKEVATRLKSCIRDNDLVARMGGDEFMFMLRSVHHEHEIAGVAERILQAFEEPFILGVHEFHVTPSMGIALYPKDGTDIETLMVQADSAMYQAKASGKNTFKFFDSDMRIITGGQLALETAMRRAIEQEQFSLHYQPQMDTQTGKLIGIEALIRWQHPTMGMIPPSRFIPLAEETGLILPIGQWVMREACRQNKAWQEAGYAPMRMSINLSAKQFTKSDLIESISSVLDETSLTPDFLELEITESMTMDVNSTVMTLNGLRKLGVQIAMDDFGTGYSSLNHLKRFGLHRLKIDQSFVRDIMTDTNDADIVGSIIVMAHRLGLRVIAEGVENKEQYEFLQEHLCDEVQGYYFSKPLPAEELESQFLAVDSALIR
ncbi:putative bifunctional diguanylate cyclase/phosphodiesterase [Paenibacillus xanthanilyticus]|uniref:Bifunctional diguanylate cyclase/phosphodiesterase n=1 Tax=Paenibacillus xanthanilyticus TaxID=1783531 RepID=A0ABV8JZS0_9BACL